LGAQQGVDAPRVVWFWGGCNSRERGETSLTLDALVYLSCGVWGSRMGSRAPVGGRVALRAGFGNWPVNSGARIVVGGNCGHRSTGLGLADYLSVVPIIRSSVRPMAGARVRRAGRGEWYRFAGRRANEIESRRSDSDRVNDAKSGARCCLCMCCDFSLNCQTAWRSTRSRRKWYSMLRTCTHWPPQLLSFPV
jgi:hypothetical protein